jgi:4-carboxymuconolactone decarboxylase
MAVRNATAQYAWSVHEPNALKQGLSQATIDAIRARRRPDFKRDDERLIYDFVTELFADKTVSAASFERAKAAFGLEGVIEAVTCAGLYGMIGFVLNVFDIPPRPGTPLT